MSAKTRRRILLAVAIVVVTPAAILALMSGMAQRPDNLGAREGRLAACPESPNCVSTQSDNPQHAIEPIQFTGSIDRAMQQLKSIIASYPRARIVTQSDDYLHVEFTSRIFRYVDDVEFLIDDSEHVIHFRSASRVGHSDMGANRRRMELIRASFDQDASATPRD